MKDLIYRQDAIDALFSEGRNVDSRYISAERIIHESDAIEAISMLPSAQQWTPVSEMLPEDEEMKLVTCRTKKGILNINRAYYMDGAWHGSGSMSGVIAWMELPEPYREDADE